MVARLLGQAKLAGGDAQQKPGSLETCGFSELADKVKAGAEKVVTKNGESFIALIGSDRTGWTVTTGSNVNASICF